MMMKNQAPSEEYLKLKQFMGLYFDWHMIKPHSKPENHPFRVLSKFEETSLSNAKKGLQMAINDIVEESADWTPQQIAAADARFSAAGTFTLSEVRRRYSKKYLQILKRGTIRSETEYYLVKGIVDGGGIEPGASEATQLQAMMNDFEVRFVAARKQEPPASK